VWLRIFVADSKIALVWLVEKAEGTEQPLAEHLHSCLQQAVEVLSLLTCVASLEK